MKKINIILVVLSVLLMLSSCTDESKRVAINESLVDKRVDIDYDEINFVDVDTLYVDMTRVEVEELYGEPVDNIGSGVSILIYFAEEGKILVLNFDPGDKLFKVKLVEGKNDPIIILGE